MDTGNRVIGTLAVTVILTTLAVRLQSDPVRPSRDAILAVPASVQPVARQVSTPVYPASSGSLPAGAPNPTAQYGTATADDSGYQDEATEDEEPYDDTVTYQEPTGPDAYINPNVDYSNLQPGMLSDQEILNQSLSAMNPDQRASFAAAWITMSSDERQEFIDEMRGE